MWLMLQQESGDDYVIATGEMHTIRDFLDASFGLVGMDWQTVVKQDQRFTRPPRSTASAATLRRPRGCSAGSRKPPSMGWCG